MSIAASKIAAIARSVGRARAEFVEAVIREGLEDLLRFVEAVRPHLPETD